MTFAPCYADAASSVRLAVDGGLIVAGGADGVVKLYRTARWSVHAQPVWSAKVHDGAVTCVVVNAKAGFAFTAGRDGHVYRHDINTTAAGGASAHAEDDTAPCSLERSRVVCRVSGEINVLVLDDVRMHLFVAGDTLRYITLGEKPAVTTVAIQLPPPIIAAALSPCGRLVAAASGATGDVCVYGLCPPPTADATQATLPPPQPSQAAAAVDDVPFPFSGTKFNLRNATPKHWRRDGGEAFACALSWCRIEPESSVYLLAVPTDDGVRILRFTPPQATPSATGTTTTDPNAHKHKPMLHTFHTVSIDKLRLLTSVRLLAHTKQDVTLVVSGQEEAAGDHSATAENEEAPHCPSNMPTTYVVKCTVKRNTVASQQTIGHFRCPSKVSDIAVDVAVGGGHLCIGTVGGGIAFAKCAVPMPRKSRSAVATIGGGGGGGGNGKTATSTSPQSSSPSKASNHPAVAATKKVTSVVNGSSSEEEEGSDSEASRSDEEEDDNDDDDEQQHLASRKKHKNNKAVIGSGGAAMENEDLDGVVKDLMRSKQHVLHDGTKRATAIRSGRGAVPSTTAGGRRAVPAYLDDEAEEAEESSDDGGNSGGGVDSEDEYDEADDHDDVDGAGSGDDENDGGVRGQSSNALLFHNGKASVLPVATSNKTVATAAPSRDYFFQPGATPLKDVEGASSASCYFSYNSIGCIRYGGDGTFVQFHDVARASIKLQEKGRVLMASMGASGAAFVLDIRGTAEAAEAEETTGADAPEMLYFRTYAALGAQADWRLPLLVGESCRCLAVGLRYVAVATNVALRIFSLSGLEMAVLSLSSRIVCMVGCNSTRLAQSLKYDQDPLAIVSLTGGSGGGGLECTVLNCHNSSVTMPPTACPVTIDPEFGDHYLQWLGWSDDGPLHTCDSAGVVRMFTRDWGGSWIPVFDPRHFTSDSIYRYWIWSVTDQHMFVYKTSRGEHGEDHFPIASASQLPMDQIRLCLPLLRTSLSTAGEKRMLLRDRFLRTTTKVNELKRASVHYTEQIAKQDVAHDAKLMEQFKAALKEQETSRAVDIATMFELRDSVEEAARHANQEGYKSVVLKLVGIVDMRHKLKLKRNCQLPLESQDISDKERDQILKKLLIKEKERLKVDPTGVAAAAPSGAHSMASSATTSAKGVQMPIALQKQVRLEAETLHAQEATPEEAAAVSAMPAAATARRTVVFEDAPPRNQTTTTAPTTTKPTILAAGPSAASTKTPTAAAAPSKPTASPPLAPLHSVKAEPPKFGKPTAPGTTFAPSSSSTASIGALGAATAAAPPTSVQPVPLLGQQQHPTAAASKPTTTTTTTATSSSSSAASPPAKTRGRPRRSTSNDRASADPPTTAKVAAPVTGEAGSPPPEQQHRLPLTTQPQQQQQQQQLSKSLGGGSSAKAVATTAALPVKPSAVVATPFDTPAPSFVDLPVDPFLQPGEDGTRVERAVRDVGHAATDAANASSQVVPKTLSFGEALRKRYREEEEDDDDDDAVDRRSLTGLFQS